MPGKEGLVRIGELADYRVPSVEDVVKVGDEIKVMVMEIDNLGRINLSRRAVLDGANGGGGEGGEGGGEGGDEEAVGARPPMDRGPRPGGFPQSWSQARWHGRRSLRGSRPDGPRGNGPGGGGLNRPSGPGGRPGGGMGGGGPMGGPPRRPFDRPPGPGGTGPGGGGMGGGGFR